jgi:hypothetical protein
MDWATVHKIARDNNVVVELGNHKDLADALRKRLVSLHPDKSGGAFPSDEAKTDYHLIQDSIDFVEASAEQSTAVVPVAQVTSLIESVTKALALRPPDTTLTGRQECRATIKADAKRRSFIPRLTSAVLATICGGVLAFAGLLKDNPLLSDLLKLKSVNGALIGGMILFGALYIRAWLKERSDEDGAEWYMSEEGLIATLERAVRYQNAHDDNWIYVTRSDFRELVGRERSSLLTRLRHRRYRSYPHLSEVASDKITDYLLQQYLERGILERMPESKLHTKFRISQQVAKEAESASGYIYGASGFVWGFCAGPDVI